jgi:hypothetical protein
MKIPQAAVWLGLLLTQAAAPQQPGIAGHYEGKLQAQGREVDVTLDLDRDARQAWIGHLTIAPNPSQLPLENITVKDTAVSWNVPSIPGSPKFDGTWNQEAKILKITAHIGGNELPIELTRTAAARVIVPEPNALLPKEFEGKWEGSLDTGTQTLRLTLTMERNAEGRASATLISVDQGGVKLPVSEIKISENELTFAVKAVNGTYKGRMNPEKDQISGDWTQFGNILPLNLKKESAPKP